MLRACVLDFEGSWDKYLPLIEFAYNNSYHSSIQMAPFEALYGRKCRTPVGWFETGEHQLLGPDLVQDSIERVRFIRERLQTAQNRQKVHADVRRRDLEFQEGDHVFLRVSPFKGTLRFGQKGKLSPRYIGPYQILRKVGKCAYELAMPPNLSHVHPVFHVSMLRKYLHDESHVLQSQPVEVDKQLTFKEEPLRIVDRQVRKLRSKEVPSVKVAWRHPKGEEFTWESEEIMKQKYPDLFVKF